MLLLFVFISVMRYCHYAITSSSLEGVYFSPELVTRSYLRMEAVCKIRDVL